jgi:hypothetical protein
MMTSNLFLLSVLLCFIVGAAIDTSNICLVRAARHLIAGKPAMVCGIVISSVAASVVYYLNTAFNWHYRSWAWAYPTWITVLGAVMFAVGAMLNGACAVGTVTRIARGDWGHLSTFAGAALAVWLLPHQAVVNQAPGIPLLSGLSWLCIVLAFAAGILFLARRHLGDVPWPSFIAVGGTAAIVTDWEGNWTWLGLLQRLQSGLHVETPVLLLIAAVFAGVVVTAVRKRRFLLVRPQPWVVLREFVGGGLMLGGAILIPGANDALAAFGVPSGSPDAVVGYLVMFAILLLLVVLKNRLSGEGGLPAGSPGHYSPVSTDAPA